MEDFGTFTDEQIARFWSRVDKRGDDECWLWTGTRLSGGYGSLGWHTTSGVRVGSASRAATWIAHGPPSTLGRLLHSRHLCDNKACVNPKHLTWGTPLQNVHDTQRALKRAGRIKTYEEREAKRRFVESDATRPTMLDGMMNYYTASENMDVGVDRPVRLLLRHLRAWGTPGSQQGRAEALARIEKRAAELGVAGRFTRVMEDSFARVSLFNDEMPTPSTKPERIPQTPHLRLARTPRKTKGRVGIARPYGDRCHGTLYRLGLSQAFGGYGYIRAIFGMMLVVTAELLEACARCQEMSILVLASGAAES